MLFEKKPAEEYLCHIFGNHSHGNIVQQEVALITGCIITKDTECSAMLQPRGCCDENLHEFIAETNLET